MIDKSTITTDRTIHLDPARMRAHRGNRRQSDVAKAAGMTQASYARLETGGRPDPRLSTAVRVARALGCRVDDLLGDG